MKYSVYTEKNGINRDIRGVEIKDQKLIKIKQSKLAYLKYISIYNGNFSDVLDFAIDLLIEKIENDEVKFSKLR